MTHRIEREKWILYRHTNNFKLICTVAEYLKYYSQTSISNADKKKLILKFKEVGLYNERNPDIPLDAINHRINTLAYYMFGYKHEIDGEKKFLFSPLGNLFLKNLNEEKKLSKIFFTMLWAVQFKHPHGGTDDSFNLYPFRLIFKLLTDERLERKIFAIEIAYLVVFIKKIDNKGYETLVKNILAIRDLSNKEIKKKFKQDEHTYVNAIYEWDYYLSKLFETSGILNKTKGDFLFKLKHGKTTYRRVTTNSVSLTEDMFTYCLKLMKEYPFDEKPLRLDDEERLTIDVIKEIYNFYPKILLNEIGEEIDDLQVELLELTKLIEKYADNNEGTEAYMFEEILEEGFNMFYNVTAKRIGGAGNTDLECLYLTRKKKFAVDAKSTKNKLSGLNAGRLTSHRDKIGGEYTIVVTPRYVPAVRQDIRSTKIVIIRASTFSEYLYNCINNNIREIDFADFDDIIIKNLGTDISPSISDLTIKKFGIKNLNQ